MNEHPELLIERRDVCLWIRFNRAEKANALSVEMMEAASASLQRAASEADVRAVLIAGAGDRAFSAGADVRQKPPDGDMATHRARRSAGLAALLDGILDCPKPVIAAINGVASGGGAMIALLCDARAAVTSAEISLPEINLGMPTFTGATVAEHVAGLALALDLVQSGRRMPASEALARGLITSVVERRELESEAMRLAAMLSGKDARAFAANKRWLNRGIKAALVEARAEHARHREKHQL